MTGTAEVTFYTREDAMACLEASLQKQLFVNASPISAEQIDHHSEEPTAPHKTRHGSLKDNSSANTGESALRTSDDLDKPIKAQQTAVSEDQDNRQETQYKVLFSHIYSGLRHYTPDGPEEDLQQMLEFAYGPVLSVSMKRTTTPAGECLLGTAEVAFATQKAAQKCIKASDEKWLYLHGRHLHAKMVETSI